MVTVSTLHLPATPPQTSATVASGLALLGPNGETLQDFIYDDVAPWPISPDGFGPSLEIINPLGDPTSSANWRASTAVGGSPGTDGLIPPIPGDYDGNGTVEQMDLIPWRSSFGLAVITGASSDGNRDGIVGAGDFIIWRKNLGLSHGAAITLTAVEVAPASGLAEQPSSPVDSGVSMASFASLDAVAFSAPCMSPAIVLGRRMASAIVARAETSGVLDHNLDCRVERRVDVTHVDSTPCLPRDPASVDSAGPAAILDSPCDLDAELWTDDAWLAGLRWPQLANRDSL